MPRCSPRYRPRNWKRSCLFGELSEDLKQDTTTQAINNRRGCVSFIRISQVTKQMKQKIENRHSFWHWTIDGNQACRYDIPKALWVKTPLERFLLTSLKLLVYRAQGHILVNYVARLSGHKNLTTLDACNAASVIHQRKISNVLSRWKISNSNQSINTYVQESSTATAGVVLWGQD